MKRKYDHDTPPCRSRGGRYKERVRSGGCSSRARSFPSPRSPHSTPSTANCSNVLCVSSLHPEASDKVIKDTLYRVYEKYGVSSIRITHELGERVAHAYFRNPEGANRARQGRLIIIRDQVASVHAVDEVPRTSRDLYRSRPRSTSADYNRHYYTRSADRLRAVYQYDTAYESSPDVPVHRDFRRKALPASHHDYLARSATRPESHMSPAHAYGPSRHAVPRAQFEDTGNKKNNFPNYLHHIQPEDDPLATRTLFVGNLEMNITERELWGIFRRYGIVEDINIKRPPQGNVYAFVRFQTLDMAHQAKMELSGLYIGKSQCKIGYGKTNPTTRIWVGGLGAWTSIPQLKKAFDRFGIIKKIEYTEGDMQAYILYDSIDAAQEAVKRMRGFILGLPDHRLRTDFADATRAQSTRAGLVASSRTLPEVARKCARVWQGALMLANTLYPAKLHLIDGDTDIVDSLMKDEDGKDLYITRFLRFDTEDVQKRISRASSHAIFLGLADSTASVTNGDATIQRMPLVHLVSYLKQRNFAGVLSLLNKETKATGVLYSFPPCPFSTELLKRIYHYLPVEAIKEDHLVIIVVRGVTA